MDHAVVQRPRVASVSWGVLCTEESTAEVLLEYRAGVSVVMLPWKLDLFTTDSQKQQHCKNDVMRRVSEIMSTEHEYCPQETCISKKELGSQRFIKDGNIPPNCSLKWHHVLEIKVINSLKPIHLFSWVWEELSSEYKFINCKPPSQFYSQESKTT